ncbi:MAG: hypothetical protein ABI600_12235 [Luteolibacter sp.]
MPSIPAPSPITWHFPLSRPHTGVPLGNALQGVLIWGESSLLLTVARAGFWDHRTPQKIPAGTTFSQVKETLHADDQEALSALFGKRQANGVFPQQFGGGRLEITFANGLRPLDASLDLATAVVNVRIGCHEDDLQPHFIQIRQATNEEVCWLDFDSALLEGLSVRLIPAYDLVRENAMAALGIESPETWTDTPGSGGFLQTLPEDMPLALAWKLSGSHLRLATDLGEYARERVCEKLCTFDTISGKIQCQEFWSHLWSRSARVSMPDATLQQQFDLGIYKQAGLVRCGTPAATLQGPWMEDTAIPPWSNDYHFNINVQLVYGAALATGQAEDMRPLWEMLRGWLPQMRALGERFYQMPGAMILPHSVDDRGANIGGMWSGTIDQACIAWMGQMAWQYYQFTGDFETLREVALPLLEGAFLGYAAMLEEGTTADGSRRFSLPVSVSPEFGGANPSECWGRDASFQLAALHATLRDLRAASDALGLSCDPRWEEISAHLPPYTLTKADNGSYGWIGQPTERIALWAGKDLPESHRHHSHLASIFPFCSINPFAPEHQKTIARSLSHWNTLGAGNWAGWCLPWASILCSRCGLADAALSWLQLLARNFTNEGHATLHNADCAGVFAWDDGSLAWPDHRKGADFLYYEVMQLDASIGAISAVMELLVSFRNDAIHIADRLPKGWRELSFERIRTAGGFIVSGAFRHGRIAELTVESARGSVLRLVHSLGVAWTLDGANHDEALIILLTEPGRRYEFRSI